jgi:hypothetical protein
MPQYIDDQPAKAAGAILQFRAVELTANLQEVQVCSATNDLAFGICQEVVTAQNATDGRIVAVRVHGISRCVAASAITRGQRVTVTGTVGKLAAMPASAKMNQVGIAMTAAGADNDHFDVYLTPGVMIDNT